MLICFVAPPFEMSAHEHLTCNGLQPARQLVLGRLSDFCRTLVSGGGSACARGAANYRYIIVGVVLLLITVVCQAGLRKEDCGLVCVICTAPFIRWNYGNPSSSLVAALPPTGIQHRRRQTRSHQATHASSLTKLRLQCTGVASWRLA